MRRVAPLFAAMGVALLVASGMAMAVTKVGTDGPDTFRGTDEGDNLLGKGGEDNFSSGPGKDIVQGDGEQRVSSNAFYSALACYPRMCSTYCGNAYDIFDEGLPRLGCTR